MGATGLIIISNARKRIPAKLAFEGSTISLKIDLRHSELKLKTPLSGGDNELLLGFMGFRVHSDAAQIRIELPSSWLADIDSSRVRWESASCDSNPPII